MQVHRFAVGEVVLFTRMRSHQLSSKSAYAIVHCISSDDAEPQYYIRSMDPSDERIAGEHELCRTPQPQLAFQQREARFFSEAVSLDAADPNLSTTPNPLVPPWHQLPLAGGSYV